MGRISFAGSTRFACRSRRPARVARSRVPLHRRLLAARSALGYWVAVVALAVATGAFVYRLARDADHARARWGRTRSVLVAHRPLPVGRRPPAGAVRRERRPAAFVPTGALTRWPDRAPVVRPVAEGEVVLAADLADPTTGPPAGRSAMAVPRGDAPLALRPGQRVDLFATFDPALGASAGTSLVAADATVLRTDRTSVTVTVASAEAPPLAAALAQATITLALTG